AIPPLRSVLADADRRLAEVAAGALASLGRRGEAVLVDALERGTIPPEISVRDTSAIPEDDLAALASLGAVTAIAIRERKPDLYDLATSARRAGEPTHQDAHRDEEPAP
ncbi:hypothetical protein G6012_12760, partial [Dietzia schimae]